ncbi:unnamed protein product [Paramecium octaurelia]|uniref:Uncharacterized protein n=1 Tax=Paramecium octaurelia TaxID=43137 RepID=A0A8S1X9C6_PAROT|nr:unnamed protein product [Paramecium octaurelia]
MDRSKKQLMSKEIVLLFWGRRYEQNEDILSFYPVENNRPQIKVNIQNDILFEGIEDKLQVFFCDDLKYKYCFLINRVIDNVLQIFLKLNGREMIELYQIHYQLNDAYCEISLIGCELCDIQEVFNRYFILI